MVNLIDIVHQEVAQYAGEGLNSIGYLTHNEECTVFSIVGMGQVKGERLINLDMLVRVEQEMVIIEADASNKPLVEALLARGVPRSQIVLAYAGETLESKEAV